MRQGNQARFASDGERSATCAEECHACFEVLFPKFSTDTINFFFAMILIAVYLATLLVDEATREQSESSSAGYEEWQCTLYTFQAKFTYAIT